MDNLEATLGRLDDYTEDTRVDFEIRFGDEALLAKRYEVLCFWRDGCVDIGSVDCLCGLPAHVYDPLLQREADTKPDPGITTG